MRHLNAVKVTPIVFFQVLFLFRLYLKCNGSYGNVLVVAYIREFFKLWNASVLVVAYIQEYLTL